MTCSGDGCEHDPVAVLPIETAGRRVEREKIKIQGKCFCRHIRRGAWAHAFEIVKKALVLDLYDIVFDEDCTVM